jgi:hypothetical protein
MKFSVSPCGRPSVRPSYELLRVSIRWQHRSGPVLATDIDGNASCDAESMNTATATATAIVRAGDGPGRTEDRRSNRLVWLLEHRAQILAVFAQVAIMAGGLLFLVGKGAAGRTVWRVAVAVLAAELAIEVVRTVLIEHSLGVDTIALVAE